MSSPGKLTTCAPVAAAISADRTLGGFHLSLRPLGVSKWSGVVAFCELKGLDTTRVLAIGDADNDIELLEEASLAVAVADASAVVLEPARIAYCPRRARGAGPTCSSSSDCRQNLLRFLLASRLAPLPVGGRSSRGDTDESETNLGQALVERWGVLTKPFAEAVDQQAQGVDREACLLQLAVAAGKDAGRRARRDRNSGSRLRPPQGRLPGAWRPRAALPRVGSSSLMASVSEASRSPPAVPPPPAPPLAAAGGAGPGAG